MLRFGIPRFTLRTLLLLVAAAAIAAAVIGRYYFRPNPITHITTRAQWDSILTNRQCVLFVDGEWNLAMAAFRQQRFQELADWCQSDTNVRALTMTIDPDDRTNDVWNISEQLRQNHNMERGSIKNFG